ncbi:MAG: hypothetical protein K8S97_15475 [Anaerolineae bacterium]|nr:hypothetical protein [Anaerolineae bacterium]
MTLLDRLILLGTGLTAIYLLWRFFTQYRQTKKQFYIYYMIAFSVLLVAGLLLIAFTYDALDNDLVVIVAVLIPAGLALGLVTEFFPQYEMGFRAFAIIGLIAIAITRFTGPTGLATAVLVVVHSTSGLIILGVPLFAIKQGRALNDFALVSVGGLLIDVGGVALAFLRTDRQLLFFSESVVFDILAPLLLLMTLAFTWGFVKRMLAAKSA